jgi:hypothetical protein
VPPPSPVEEHAGLVARYEELRSQALAGRRSAGGHGLALLAARGVAAWMAAWRSLRPAPAPVLVPVVAPGVVADPRDDVVSVLAAMATACLGG